MKNNIKYVYKHYTIKNFPIIFIFILKKNKNTYIGSMHLKINH